MSFSYQSDFDRSNDDFANVSRQFTSVMDWMLVASIVMGIIGTAAKVAIVYFIVDCLKKAGTAIPSYASSYAKISPHDLENPSRSHHSYGRSGGARSSSSSENIDRLPDGFETLERALKPVRFTPEQLVNFTDDYSTVLGSGAYGVVFKAELPNGLPVAVKLLTSTGNKRIDDQFMAEVSSIGRIHHINLVKLHGFCFDSTTRALVYEYMENGSLDRFLFGEKTWIDWARLHQIALGTAKGIAYLHEECQERIVHYDIKPGNILLDRKLEPKVADFGLAKLCNRETSQIVMTGFRGTPGYAAPELWKPFPVTFKCDIYSFGMLLFEIVCRRKNHDENRPESKQWLPRWAWDMFEHNELPIMVSLCGIEDKDRAKAERMLKVALLCIQYEPEKRPLMSHVVKMLDGDVEIPPPDYPFRYLDPIKPSSDTGDGSSFNDDTDASSTIRTRVHCKGSCSRPHGRALEIELCSTQ